jgi:hypothetical protein
MTHRVSLVLLALICAGCASHPRPALVPTVDETGEIRTADAVQYETQRAFAAEPGVLALAKSVARRDGHKLVLTREDGKTVEIADSPQCAGNDEESLDCVRRVLAAWLPSRHAFVIDERHYEGGAYILVDTRSGAQLRIDSPPHFSPDGSRFATFDKDDENEADGVRIWVRHGDGFVSEWDKQAAVDFIGWDGNDRLLVKIDGRSGAIVRSASGWTLQISAS